MAEKKPLGGGRRDLRKRAMADAAAKLAPTIDARAAIDAIPRSYNFAVDIIERNLKAGRANKPVYIDPRGSWTYGELAERVDRFGHVLRSLGVRREERILLALLDTIDWPTAFLGAIKAGVVPIPVNTLMTEDDYRFMLADSRAKVLVVSEALLAKFANLIGSGSDLLHVIVSGENAGGHRGFEDLLAGARPEPYTAPTTRDDICFWLYTSGSTGKPKGAVHVHANLRLTADLYASGVLGLQESDVCYSVAKLFFAYGLGNAMTFPMAVGATTILSPERPTPETVAAILRRHPVTVFYAVPTFYAAFLVHPGAPKRADLKLKYCVSAGEALPPDVGRRWKERYGVDVLDGIGSTEMLHIFISNYPGEVKYGTTGKPVPGYDIRLVDDDGNLITRIGEMGELQARPDVGGHVLERPRADARDLPGRMDALRRQIRARRGRSLRLLRAARRHAQGRRHLCLAVRGRRRALHPSRRVGGRGRCLAGRRRADQAQGLRGAQVRRQDLRGAGAGVAGARQDHAGALQISALDRISRGAPQDRNRQDPALQAARRAGDAVAAECGLMGAARRVDAAGDMHYIA
jgi:benzoate-CoA ligase family protein